MGSPAKPVTELTGEQIQKLKESAEHYVKRFKRFKRDLAPDSRFS